jgi:hypothetical protein
VAPLAIPAHGRGAAATLLVGVITCMLILKGARLTKRIPPLIGLIGGIAAYRPAYCGLAARWARWSAAFRSPGPTRVAPISSDSSPTPDS